MELRRGSQPLQGRGPDFVDFVVYSQLRPQGVELWKETLVSCTVLTSSSGELAGGRLAFPLT